MFRLYFLLIILSFSVFAKTNRIEESLRSKILRSLPDELAELSRNKTLKETKAKFSKNIIKEENETLYLAFFSKGNDLTFGFKQDKIDYILLEIPPEIQEKNKFLFQEVSSYLNSDEKQKIHQQIRSSDDSQSRFIVIDLPSEKIKLVFNNSSQKEIKSILVRYDDKK